MKALASVLAGLTVIQLLPALVGGEAGLDPGLYVLGAAASIPSIPGMIMLAPPQPPPYWPGD